MRASLLLVVVVGLFACGEAVDLDGLKDLGKNLLDTLVSKGKDLLAGLGKNLLDQFGKRDLKGLADIVHGIIEKLHNVIDNGKTLATDAFGDAIDKLRALTQKFHAKIGLVKDADEIKDEIDDIVAEHHVVQKRILSHLLNAGKSLFSTLVGAGKAAVSTAVNAVKGTGSFLKKKASEAVSGLLQKGADVFFGKRATLGDHLSNIGKAIGKSLSPFKDIVASLGSTLKGHFSNLVNTVKGHVTALKGKLSGHADDLKKHGSTLLKHGQNALGALGEVVSDVLKQTLSNAGPAIDGLSKTLAGAAKTTLDHFTGADKTSTF